MTCLIRPGAYLRKWMPFASVLAVVLSVQIISGFPRVRAAADRTLDTIAAYLQCIDLDCNSKLEAVRKVGASAVLPLVDLLDAKTPSAIPGVTGQPNLVRVCIALGKLRDPRSVRSLERALGQPDPVLRAQALVALGSVGDRSALSSVISRLGDPDAYVRESAANALAELGREAETDILRAFLTSESSPVVRRAIQRALGVIEARSKRR